jgi:hypothetical protein
MEAFMPPQRLSFQRRIIISSAGDYKVFSGFFGRNLAAADVGPTPGESIDSA